MMNMSSDFAADFKAYQDRVTSSLVSVTRSVGSIANHDLSFHRSMSEKVSKSLDSQNTHLLRLTSKLLKAATKDSNVKVLTLRNRDDIEDNWRSIVDVVDDLLEKADANLDEYDGMLKKMSPAQPSTPEASPSAISVKSKAQPIFPAPYKIPKPQLLFERKVDNNQTGFWKPLLKSKPYALVPLSQSIGDYQNGFNHPYAREIDEFEYPDFVYQQSPPIPYLDPNLSEPIWVDTEEGVLEMLEQLKTAREIAIDLEHNDKNSYIGMVSLMQISTRSQDWIVDTLMPWRENLQILNEVFADPNKVKVFHGSTSDMVWLQRDLGLYVVGLFDTYYACVALNFTGRGLAFLLLKYCNFLAQKQYQLADWRIRPLPQELLDYARSDTHFLLYIYDHLRNELLQNSTPNSNFIEYVLENSKKEALQVYERHEYDKENGLGPHGWLRLILQRSSKTFDQKQFGVYRELHEWRDKQARINDEGVDTIMPNAFLWNCAEFTPQNRHELWNARIMGKVPRHIGIYFEDVLDAVKRGQRLGAEGPTIQEVIDRNADKLESFNKFKRSHPNAKPQELRMSVAATMQRLVQNGGVGKTNETVEDAEIEGTGPVALRSILSSLWGSMKPETPPQYLDPSTARKALESIMPLQTYINSVDETTSDGSASKVKENGAPEVKVLADGETQTNSNPDHDTFVLRNVMKRKADEIDGDEMSLIPSPNDPGVHKVTERDGGEPPFKSHKASKKAAKKARKAMEKEAAAAQAQDLKPFDYANAPSVLYPQAETNTIGTTTDSTLQKAFNPYAKALDTSTGAKPNKMGKELAGKSYTFKS